MSVRVEINIMVMEINVRLSNGYLANAKHSNMAVKHSLAFPQIV